MSSDFGQVVLIKCADFYQREKPLTQLAGSRLNNEPLGVNTNSLSARREHATASALESSGAKGTNEVRKSKSSGLFLQEGVGKLTAVMSSHTRQSGTSRGGYSPQPPVRDS